MLTLNSTYSSQYLYFFVEIKNPIKTCCKRTDNIHIRQLFLIHYVATFTLRKHNPKKGVVTHNNSTHSHGQQNNTVPREAGWLLHLLATVCRPKSVLHPNRPSNPATIIIISLLAIFDCQINRTRTH